MAFRGGKLILILLVPALLYGAAKAVLYYKAKRTLDDMVVAVSNQADVRYADIETDLRGAVTVRQITIQPRAYQDSIGIDSVRISSDDPMFFIHGAQWEPGRNAPPPRLAFAVNGLQLPLASDLVSGIGGAASADATSPDNPCAQGLKIEPALLQRIGFADINMDMEGRYQLDEQRRELEIGMHFELRDIESVDFSATLTDVDIETLALGGAPQFNLGRLSFAMRVAPEFGRQALKTCAIGSDQPVQAWSTQLADRAIADFEAQGVTLGFGLENAVRSFYRDWGEFRVDAVPAKPVGMMSLMFLSPDKLVSTLGLRLTLNGAPIDDTGFRWEQPDPRGLSALFGGQPEEAESDAVDRPRRIIVRREYQPVAVADIARYVDSQVQIKPRAQPQREGVLKRIANGEAVVEQTLHGGKFTVYVKLADIESMQVLVQRELPDK